MFTYDYSVAPRERPAHERVLDRLTGTQHPDGCWEWRGATFRKGYGNVRCRKDDGTWGNRGSHVVMWEHANQRRLADGMVVMHQCDNPPCCNPRHLTEGTQAKNLHDAQQRGRINWRAIATKQQQPHDPASGRFTPR